jgi:hypothetical protein
MSTTSLLWHYTIGQNYRLILAHKAIKPSAAYTGTKDWPVVWFSRNQVWESSATKGLEKPDGTWQLLTLDELREVGGGLYRIGVAREAAPHNWDDFVRTSGIAAQIAADLKRAAKEKGASHKDWFASFDPVDSLQWLAVEVWENHQWISVENSKANQVGRSFDVGWRV